MKMELAEIGIYLLVLSLIQHILIECVLCAPCLSRFWDAVKKVKKITSLIKLHSSKGDR